MAYNKVSLIDNNVCVLIFFQDLLLSDKKHASPRCQAHTSVDHASVV